jgi:hypothetical protein
MTDFIQELREAKDKLETTQNEWLEIIEDLVEAKDESKNEDLFARIEYLTLCDQICKTAYSDAKELEVDLHHIEALKKKNLQNAANSQFIEDLLIDTDEVKRSMEQKIESIIEEYSLLADAILREAQNVISKFSETMQREKDNSDISDEINQNLDKELFLQELRDSLESYRQSREEYVSELEAKYLEQLPESRVPEDLGEEMPEIDPILSQIDTLITECDSDLLIKEITD